MLGVDDGASSPATTTEQRPLAAKPFKLKAGTPSVAGGPFFDGREPLSARESKVQKAQSGAPYQVTHADQPETCTTPADTARRVRDGHVHTCLYSAPESRDADPHLHWNRALYRPFLLPVRRGRATPMPG